MYIGLGGAAARESTKRFDKGGNIILGVIGYRLSAIVDSESTIGRCTQQANSQLIPQISMKYLG
jgi:hypothetical protein